MSRKYKKTIRLKQIQKKKKKFQKHFFHKKNGALGII